MTWIFEVVPQTNQQTFRATIRSTHPWLTMETTGSPALTPGNVPPAQISTLGESRRRAAVAEPLEAAGPPKPRGSRQISPGPDCQQATFVGQVVLTKQ